ncbi:MAG: response regulator [Flammeovirgaceae bacterium]
MSHKDVVVEISPQQITEGITSLLKEVNGNKSLLVKVIDDFIYKTPLHFKEVTSFVETNNFNRLRDKLHLLKVRYGYLGLKDVMQEMEYWENNGQFFTPDKNKELLQHFENINLLIERTLRTIDINFLGQKEMTAKQSALIVDDDELNNLILKGILEELGYSVTYSSNGYSAIQLVQEKLFNVVFIDIHMPFFSGVEAIKRIRPINSNMLIVAISASKDTAEVEECLKEGADEFLPKPIKPIQLSEALKALLKA